MRYNTYLFDFDGTLVDSMPTYAAVMLKILDDNGIRYDNDIVKLITPLGYKGTAEYYRKEYSLDMETEEIIALMEKYALDEYKYNIRAKRNVISTLKELRADGADLNVLTASPHATLDPCLKRLGIYDVFSNIWSCSDFDTTKSDPMIYKAAAEKLGKPVYNILFADDNYVAVKTAKQAGMKTCGVYDKSSENYTYDIKRTADSYIYDFSELLELR